MSGKDQDFNRLDDFHNRDSQVTLNPDQVARRKTTALGRFARRLVTVKTFEPQFHVQAIDDNPNGSADYRKALSAFDLTLIGIGGIIGAGIFVLTGKAAAQNAGPALILSFVFAGVAAGLSSLCYAEMAALVPVSGSAYTYAYATLGEMVAWIIGWDLLLEYLVGAATVAVGWSGYFCNFIHIISGGNLVVDPKWSNAPYIWREIGESNATTAGFYRNSVTCADGTPCDAIVDAPAVLLTALITTILAIGVRTSSTVNGFFVIVKLVIVVLFILIGIRYINRDNYVPFIPENQAWGVFGWSGIFHASTTVFFAYIGFDAVSTTAQEAKNPQRDLPIGILASLGICTSLYLAVTAVLTGVQKYTEIDIKAPVASAIPIHWLSVVIDIGALAGLFSVMMVLLLGQPRILQAMASDGLLPSVFAKINSKTNTPLWGTFLTGGLCAILAGLLPIDILGNLTSIGTLFAFAIVSAAVPILRYTRPDLERRFEVPGGRIIGGFVIPGLGFLTAIGLIAMASVASIYRLFAWMGVGLLIYAFFGYRNSKASKRLDQQIAFQRPKKEILGSDPEL
ncbi:Cationic amino acid transporter-1 [Blyttiomyces sp. JEL0837]|nr:Cationic amino acid transporter-1 [Blyttiomyces sp. JEL0837]